MKIESREDYYQNIHAIRAGLKRPYLQEFIELYFGKRLSRERYKKIETRVKNYLFGISYISGVELGLNQKLPEFYNRRVNDYAQDQKENR